MSIVHLFGSYIQLDFRSDDLMCGVHKNDRGPRREVIRAGSTVCRTPMASVYACSKTFTPFRTHP